jgi:hypothetical protein
MDDVTISRSPLDIPIEEQRRYAGQWVALRGGKVVAGARSLKRLRKNPAVRDSDAVTVMLDPDKSYFFAAA